MSNSNRWIIRHRPRPEARLRLFCFPHSGSGASSFRDWPKAFPADLEVCAIQAPGRESRWSEPPIAAMEPFLSALLDGVRDEFRRPYALFGHSVGAWQAFALANRLIREGFPAPAHVFVSGRRAPQMPSRIPVMHTLPDDQLVQQLDDLLGGLPNEVLENRELLQLLLPCLRADLTIAETYLHTATPPLPCPLSAFGGLSDPSVLRDDLDGWQAHTLGAFRLDLLPGGHFFPESARTELTSLVRSRL